MRPRFTGRAGLFEDEAGLFGCELRCGAGSGECSSFQPLAVSAIGRLPREFHRSLPAMPSGRVLWRTRLTTLRR